MTLVRPTRAASDWNTENVLAIELLYDQLIHPHKFATPTLKLLIANMRRDELGPDMKFGWDIITKHFSPSIAKKAQVFSAPTIDNLTRMEYTPALQYNSVGSDDITMALYTGPKARLNFINLMIESMHQGYTDAFAYSLFSTWNETISGDNKIDISGALSSSPNPPQELTLNEVTSHTDRMFSIPMLMRYPTVGHTLGNIPVTTTTNQYWHPTETVHTAAVPVRSGAGNANVDVITSVANPQPADLDDFSEHFDNIQLGWHYSLYNAVGSGLYRQLVALLLAITRRDIASPLGELGIRASIEWQDYNATFYKEPMMTWLHPYTCFSWDPDTMFLLSDSRFDPTVGTGIYQWERIPASTMQASAMYHICQLITPDRRGLGGMYGYTNS